MQTGLEGKTVLISEADANFGGDTALAFAGEGANLVLATAGGVDALEPIAQQAAERGVDVATFSWDISDPGQVHEIVQQGLTRFGKLDVLVNNAVVPMSYSSLEDIPFNLWQRKMQVELTGTSYVCKEVLTGMIQQQWGRVINYVGLAAFLGTAAPDSATGLGLVGLTRGIARDYGKHNITANCIGPGGIETSKELGLLAFPPSDDDPLPRWGKPQEIGFLAVSLASEEAGYLTGQCLLANGGKYFL